MHDAVRGLHRIQRDRTDDQQRHEHSPGFWNNNVRVIERLLQPAPRPGAERLSSTARHHPGTLDSFCRSRGRGQILRAGGAAGSKTGIWKLDSGLFCCWNVTTRDCLPRPSRGTVADSPSGIVATVASLCPLTRRRFVDRRATLVDNPDEGDRRGEATEVRLPSQRQEQHHGRDREVAFSLRHGEAHEVEPQGRTRTPPDLSRRRLRASPASRRSAPGTSRGRGSPGNRTAPARPPGPSSRRGAG